MFFRVSPDGKITKMASLPGVGIYEVKAGLIPGSDGNFYGTSRQGGEHDQGTAFRMSPIGSLTILAHLDAQCYASLIQDENDDFPGTTSLGIFKMTPSGQLTTIKEFVATQGPVSHADLVQGQDGHFYGTTEKGGANDPGSLYRRTAEGTPTSVISFNQAKGAFPRCSLVADGTGSFYGTTTVRGLNNKGTVFKLSEQGVFSTLVHFDSEDGAYPQSGLLLGQDGNFYGTTANYDLPNQYGSIFKTTPHGTLTVLAPLALAHGVYPQTALIPDPEGHLLGTTFNHGPGGKGTIFKMTPAGVLTRLVSFDDSKGGYPSDPLVPGPDGNYYGTTQNDLSAPSFGTIFRITPLGELTRLQFPAKGAPPGLTMGLDGRLYGTTGPSFNQTSGTIFFMTTDGFFKTLTTFSGVRTANPASGLV